MLPLGHAAAAHVSITAPKWPRRRVLSTGRVILHNHMTVDCVIRDLSVDGARLVFDLPIGLEPFFQLLVTTTHSVLPVELVWQHGTAAGVRFGNGASLLSQQ